jgi:hypothetical protein
MPQDNRIVIAIGAGLAVVAAVVLALVFGGGRDGPDTPPPAAQGGLTVDVADAPGLDTNRELECYVDGVSVGMASLATCARRNGLATDALDVGVDQSGAVVAFSPPPGPPPLEEAATADARSDPQVVVGEDEDRPAPRPAAGQACLRHAGGSWRTLAPDMSLGQCVQALYAGTCVRPGDALYGRWGDSTLRLVPRRVEQSFDNNRFRTLTDQDRGCQFPDLR